MDVCHFSHKLGLGIKGLDTNKAKLYVELWINRMRKFLKRILLAGLWMGLLTTFITGSRAEAPVPVYFFWGDGCPYCELEKSYLNELVGQYPHVEVRSYEVWNNLEARQIFFLMADSLGFEPSGVPMTVIGNRYWIGFHESLKVEIESAVIGCTQSPCPDMGIGIVPGLEAPAAGLPVVAEPAAPVEPAEPVDEVAPGEENTIVLPLIGAVDLGAHSLGFSTAVIAFVDGFNPCSLWVLSILLALVIHSGSRKKTLLVGLTFLLVTTSVYVLFIVGLFKVFTFVSFVGWIQVVVATVALGFALINIKDYFWYKEGISLTISDKHKPKLYRDVRSLLAPGKSSLALIGATIVMALGISLVELPCTAGFPVLWTNLVAAQNVDTLTFTLLLGLYMAIYLLDELVVFVTVVVTLRASKLEEKHGRLLKLVGGVVMLALAIVLLVDPELMNNINSSLVIFGSAFGAAGLLLLVHRKILPRFGIYIGSEGKKRGRRRKKATT
jgi:cytochrome c biogenesis protein CcdA/thiol-disulfide isomerase/thioredoxin